MQKTEIKFYKLLFNITYNAPQFKFYAISLF
jgi:hypothetical protein